MDYNLEIQKLRIKTDEAPLVNDKLNLIKQAIAIADTHNDAQWGYDLRIDLIDEESNTTRCVDSFAAFTWILDMYDRDPELFEVEYLIGKYRWMISESYRNVNVSMAQVHQILADFKARLTDKGYSLRTYYSAKADLGFFLNNSGMIAKNINLRNQQDVNPLFDYWLSEVYADIEFALRQGKFELAAQIERQISLNELEHWHYPLAIYTSFTRYLSRVGKFDQAYHYFLKAEECLSKLGNDQSHITSISKLIQFLSIYKKEDEAWRYFEQYVNWTVDCEDCTAAFFSMDMLHLLKKKGEKVLYVSPQLAWYRPDNTYQISDLYKYYRSIALDLAKRFDARNGSNMFTQRLKKSERVRSANWFSTIWNKLFGKTT